MIIIRMIDGIVDFFRPSSFRARRALIKRMAPVLKRSMIHYWKRNLLIMICIVFCVYTSVIFYAYLGMVQSNFASQVDYMKLPVKGVLGRMGAFTRAELDAVRRTPKLTESEDFVFGQRSVIESVFGRKEAFVFSVGSQLASQIVGGSVAEPALYVPEDYADLAAEQTIVSIEDAGGNRHVHYFPVKTYKPNYDYFSAPVVVTNDEALLSSVNQIYIVSEDEELDEIIPNLKERLVAAAMSAMPGDVESGIEDDVVRDPTMMVSPFYYVDRNFGKHLAARIQANKLSTARNTLALVYLFSLVAVYNILFISLHERQREVGILKTLGLEHNEIFVMLQTETLYCSIAGVAITPILTYITFWVVRARFGLTLALSPWNLLALAVVSVILFYVGAIIPSLLIRQASISSLLRGEGFKRDNQWEVMHHDVWA